MTLISLVPNESLIFISSTGLVHLELLSNEVMNYILQEILCYN